jgi:hypothetical protein
MAGGDVVELLFRLFAGPDSQPASGGVFGTHLRPSSGKLLIVWDELRSHPQPPTVGLRARAARSTLVGVLPRLCSGTEPSRVSVVALEAARAAEFSAQPHSAS